MDFLFYKYIKMSDSIIPLQEYIEQYFGTQAKYAEYLGVSRQHVSSMANKGYLVYGDTVYKPLRKALPTNDYRSFVVAELNGI